MELIASYTAPSTQTSVGFTSIPSTYTDLLIVASLRSADNVFLSLNFNGSSSNMVNRQIQLNSGTDLQVLTRTDQFVGYGQVSINGVANTFSYVRAYFPNYANTSFIKTWGINMSSEESTGSSGFAGITAGVWNVTSAINALSFNSGEMVNSTIYLYGIKNA
jgi:hypothetical protein